MRLEASRPRKRYLITAHSVTKKLWLIAAANSRMRKHAFSKLIWIKICTPAHVTIKIISAIFGKSVNVSLIVYKRAPNYGISPQCRATKIMTATLLMRSYTLSKPIDIKICIPNQVKAVLILANFFNDRPMRFGAAEPSINWTLWRWHLYAYAWSTKFKMLNTFCKLASNVLQHLKKILHVTTTSVVRQFMRLVV